MNTEISRFQLARNMTSLHINSNCKLNRVGAIFLISRFQLMPTKIRCDVARCDIIHVKP